MNEKLTIQDIIGLLAAKHNLTKKDAEIFVKEFFLLIEQALEKEQVVKIKGLGTFKLTEVESRESVNVNTGERFRIEGHTKVSFSPDTNVRDAINKPFAHFETVLLHENTKLEDTPVESDEESVENNEDQEDKELSLTTSRVSQVFPIGEKKLTAEEIIAQELQNTDLDSLHPHLEENSTNAFPSLIDSTQRNSLGNKRQVEKSPLPYLIAVIIAVLLLCGGVVLFMYFPDLLSSSKNNDLELSTTNQRSLPTEEQSIAHTVTVPTSKDSLSTEISTPVPPIKEPQIEVNSQNSNSIQPTISAGITYKDSAVYKIVGTKTQYVIKEGETLTKVSLRFYGTKAMWPYIVKHNAETIKNPDNVPYGTKINVPELALEE